MFQMNGIDWYTDTFDSFRVVESIDGGITKHERKQVLFGVPCRAYRTPTNEPSMEETAARLSGGNALCCDVETDIKAGDEIIVYRSSAIRAKPVSVERFFAGNPNVYVEPFGGVLADLEHLQVALYNEERID